MYDSTGARFKKTASGTTTVYLGKDYDVTGSLSTKYIFLGDRRVALKDSSAVALYFHEDHINSSNVITDSSGNQAAMYEYTPYGETATHTGSTDVKHQFTGQEKDDSTHLHYYNARYYDSQLGRFITADPTIQHPADPQDFNRYAYARNNPIKFTDPTGLGFFSKLFGIIGAAIGAVLGLIGGGPAGAVAGAQEGYKIGTVLGQAVDNIIAASQSGGSTPEMAIKIAIALNDANQGRGDVSDGNGDGVSDSSPWYDIVGTALHVSLKIVKSQKKSTAENSSHSEMKQTAQFTNQAIVAHTNYDSAERHRLAMFTVQGMMNMWNQSGGGAGENPGMGGATVLSPAYIAKMQMAQKVNPARETVPEVVKSEAEKPKSDGDEKPEKPKRKYRHDKPPSRPHRDPNTGKKEPEHWHYQDSNWDPNTEQWRPGKWEYGGPGAPPS